MQRRTFLGGSAAILAGPLSSSDAFAEQPTKLPLIGFLGIASHSFTGTPLAAFLEGLKDQGFIEGKNVAIEYRWVGGDQAKLPALAAELVRLGPDVLVTAGGSLPAQAAQEAARTIPIIATSAAAAVKNFARPGGNLTGAATQTSDLNPKRLQFLREAVPAATLVGVLLNSANPGTPDLVAFRQGLAEAGYAEAQNVIIEYRWAEGRFDRLPASAADLVARKVDVIFASGSAGIQAAKSATSTIPIVFLGGGDLVGAGLVASLARPGGNLTGFSIMATELEPKRFDPLSEVAPKAKVIGLLVNPNSPAAERAIADVSDAARLKGVQLHILKASAEGDFESAYASLVELQAGALVVAADPFFNSRRQELVALAARHAVPAIYEWREFAELGGLMSYGPSQTDMFRQVGAYVGRILAGAKPADLPVQQPTRFELVVNLKTAKALGLTVPPSILARADEVIE